MDEMPEIELGILAGEPLLYVVSGEEERFLKDLERICVHRGRKLWVYSITTGLKNIAFINTDKLWRETQRRGVLEDLKDPISLLENLRGRHADEGIFVLLDFHALLKDQMIQRLLKDVTLRFKEKRNTLVIISPVVELPRNMEHLACLIQFPLPRPEVLSAKLESILETMRRRGTVVKLNPSERERIAAAGQGLTLAEFENALARALIKGRGCIGARIIDDIVGSKKQIISKSGLLEFFDTRETMDGVGGLNNLKEWLNKRQRAFSEEAAAFGLPSPKGMLLLGVQGCGKSLTAKACASLWKFPLLRLDTGRLFSSQVGSSEENCRQAIQVAEALAPCILWIDEIEKAMAGVGSSGYSDAGTAARVFATLATWLQEKTAPVFVIATANTVTALPPELVRKGRWDEVFFLDLPGAEERRIIIRIHLEKRGRNPNDFDTERLAEACPGFSGAEIEQVIISGLYDAFDEGRPLVAEDILRNIHTTVPLSKSMAEPVQALRSWALSRARPASDERLENERRQWRSGNMRPV
jgi:SpoVK/Ycf46/Vps4 family AAA+-type ATPase